MNTPPPDLASLPGLPSGRALFLSTFAAHLKPPPEVDVGEWAARYRYVAAESGSPYPGEWRRELVPYLPEIETCLSFHHPARVVTFKKSAQVGGSEVGVNMLGSTAHQAPAPVLIVLPTWDEAKKYNKVKLQPTINATPVLRRAISEIKSRDEESSTALKKQFRGGFAIITGANSSAGLQMISARVRLYEEICEYPPEAGDRGGPIEQGEARGKAWDARRPKTFLVSTPGLKGACLITDYFEASDQRRYYVPCPHCGAFQILVLENLRWDSPARPHGAHFVCASAGCVIRLPRQTIQ